MTIRFPQPATRLACSAAFAALVLAAPTMTAQTASPGEPSKARLMTLDIGGMDSGTQACTDFYQYANGGWLTSNPIPSDRPRWGTFDELFQRNQNDLRATLERLAADRSAPEGSEERKLGDFYASCMDEAAIETNNLKPIEPDCGPKSGGCRRRGSASYSRSARKRTGRTRRRSSRPPSREGSGCRTATIT
jgi:putative endopeptidase